MIKILNRFFFFSFAILVTMSCQNKSDTVQRVLKEPNFKELAEKQKVVCYDQEGCSASVGNLIGYSATKLNNNLGYQIRFGNCTGSLIAEDLVITNRHCFLNKDIKAGDKCSRIFIKFPQVREYPEELAECKEIIFRPEIEPKTPEQMVQNLDIAIIKLTKPVKRPILNISKEGFQNNEWATIHRFTTQESGSYLEALHCPVIQDAAIYETARLASSSASAFIYLADCPIIESNSGSPILDSHSSIKGVVSAQIESIKVKNMFPKNADKFKDAAIGINLACADHAALGFKGQLAADCEATLNWDKQKHLSNERLKQLEANRLDLLSLHGPSLEAKAKQHKISLDYKPVIDKAAGFLDFLAPKNIFWFSPLCFESLDQAANFYKDLTTQSVPVFIEDKKFDEYGRLHEKINTQIFHITEVHFANSDDDLSVEIIGEHNGEKKIYIQKSILCGK